MPWTALGLTLAAGQNPYAALFLLAVLARSDNVALSPAVSIPLSIPHRRNWCDLCASRCASICRQAPRAGGVWRH